MMSRGLEQIDAVEVAEGEPQALVGVFVGPGALCTGYTFAKFNAGRNYW